MVRRARRGAERAQLLVEEAHAGCRVEERLRLLEQEALVRRAAALGHEQELVGVAVDRVDLDLRGQVGAGVLLVVHVERRHLRVAQVVVGVGVEDAARDRLVVAAAGEHVLALLAHHDRGAGVLARRQHAAGGDVRVLQQLERDEPSFGEASGSSRIARELREVAGPQQVRDVAHRLAREQRERLGLDLRNAGRPPSNVDTWSVVSSRYGVSSAPSGSMSW